MEVLLAEVLLPRVGVRVELHERERAVFRREDAKLRERDRVVAAHGGREDPRVDDRCESFLDLPVRALRVAGGYRQVAVVDDRKLVDDVDVVNRVVRTDQRRRRPDRLRPEA